MGVSKNPLHGDIYWANLDPVKGSEQSGHRPVLIVSNNLMNKVSPVVLIAPMTRTDKVIKPFIIPFEKEDLILFEGNINRLSESGYKFDRDIEESNILCQQSRSISKDRLIMKVGKFRTDKYAKLVKDAISFLYSINGCARCNYPMRKHGLRCRNCKKVHHIKCFSCSKTFDNSFRFCPHCGKWVRKKWWK